MKLTHITCLLLFFLASHQAWADDESSTETNEIIPREAIQKLDFSVRQALLRAIDKLEKEANENEEIENDNDDNDNEPQNTTIVPTSITIQSTTAVPVTAPNKEEILEESTSRSDIFPSIQFFTATYDENNAQEQPLALFIDKSKKKTHKNLGSPVLVTTNVKEELKDNNQTARSVNNNIQANEISANSFDEIKFEIRNSKTRLPANTEDYKTTTTTTLRPKTTKKRTTTTSTTTTTTTTTPRPTHNEDGENIEVVAKDDIRILAAPLVSAFTVDLDESGAAKKVIPIIDSPASTTASVLSSTKKTSSIFHSPPFGPTITKLNVLPSDTHQTAAINLANNLPPVPTQATFGTSTANSIFTNIVPASGHYITKQPLRTDHNQKQPQHPQQDGNFNSYLIEKQRELEQQIYQLKLQAQQQQELILRQLKLLEEQAKLRSISSSNPTSANNLSQNQASNNILHTHAAQQQQQPQQLSLIQQHQEPGFTIRPSVEFIPSTPSKIAPIYTSFPLEQQLPLKESNDKYVNGGGQQQQQQSNRFVNSIAQPQNQQQQPQQRLPTDNPIQQVFHKLQNLQNFHKPKTQATSSISNIQIQPSNQLNIVPTFASLLPQAPAELSLVQALPQHNYQQFQQTNPIVPQYVTDALLERQQQLEQQQNRARLFRQEGDTGNFGINQVQIQPNSNNIFSSYNSKQQQPTNNFDNQNFYRQQLIPALSNQLQHNAQTFYQQQQQTQPNSPTGNFIYNNQRFQNNRLKSLNQNFAEFNIINKVLALNHGINNFAQQTLLPPVQDSSAPAVTQPLAQSSAHFNSNIF